MSNLIEIPTGIGTLVAEDKGNVDYPGISVYYRLPDGTTFDIALIERRETPETCSKMDGEQPEDIAVYIWNKLWTEEYSTKKVVPIHTLLEYDGLYFVREEDRGAMLLSIKKGAAKCLPESKAFPSLSNDSSDEPLIRDFLENIVTDEAWESIDLFEAIDIVTTASNTVIKRERGLE